MCPIFWKTNSPAKQDKHAMERLLELHRKIRSKLCKEIFCHSIAVIVFSGLVIVAIVDILKYRDPDPRKLLAALLGISHFGLCTTAILHLKYCGVMEMNALKCKIWIYLEVYNIAATTAFIVLATRHLLPPPFHQWTGTGLLLIIYWLPLIMYKTSQVCQMLEFISILNYLHDTSINAMRKHCYESNVDQSHIVAHNAPIGTKNNNNKPAAARGMPCGHVPFTTTVTTPLASAVVPPVLPPINKLISSPQIPYEWALINSINNALP